MDELMKDIDAVIFDMDGTLVDSMWVWLAVDEDYIQKYNLTEPEGFHEKMEGMSYSETAQYFLEIFPELPMTLDEVMDEWHEMAYDKYVHDVPLKDGALEFLREIRARGMKTGIATSNSRELVDDTLKALGIDGLFDSVKTSGEAGAGKPAPDVYLMVAKELDVPAEKCLVFEDVPMGILAGKNAGMRVCAVDDTFSRPQEEKKRTLADYYIQTYDDIAGGTYEIL